ncbi:MAG: hypothetical protein AAGI01_13235 [Myxococcota bacterium]
MSVKLKMVCTTLACAMSLLSVSGSASALELDDDLKRDEFTVIARANAIFVPNFVLDPFFEEHANVQEPPQNMAYGAMFSWRKSGEYELALAVDFADLSAPGTFWKQAGEPASSAKYTEVDLRLLSVVFATYWYWDALPWLSPYFGGGIGAGFVLGDVVEFSPREGSECRVNLGAGASFAPDSCFGADGEPDPTQVNLEDPERSNIVPIVPMVHLAMGLRFHIAEYAVLKLEAGINNYVYAGASVGVQWW